MAIQIIGGSMAAQELSGIMAELHLSQVNLAYHIGVDERTVRRWVGRPEKMPGTAVQALRAWVKCHRAGLGWGKCVALNIAIVDDKVSRAKTAPDDFMPDELLIKARHGQFELGCDLRTFKRGPEEAVRHLRHSLWLAADLKSKADSGDATAAGLLEKAGAV